MTRQSKSLRTTVAALAVGALALVGCETDDNDTFEQTNPGITEPGTTEPAPAPAG